MRRIVFFVMLAIAASAFTPSRGLAQTTGDVSGANGVIIDADGVLRLQHFPDPGGQLTKKRIA